MTVVEVRRIRRWLYSLYALGATSCLVLWALNIVGGGQVRLVLGYGTLGVLDIIGARCLRKNVDIFPIYTVEKGLAGFSFMMIMVLGLAGYSQVYPGLAWLWIGVLYFSKVVALQFILKKGILVKREFVQTEHGPEEVPDSEVMDRTSDTVAGWLRHGYISTTRRTVIKQSLGIEANDSWTKDLLDNLRTRRERASADTLEQLELEDFYGSN